MIILTRDKQIGLPLRGRPILLSLVWLQTELDSTQSYYHYLSIVKTLAKSSQANYCLFFSYFSVAKTPSEILARVWQEPENFEVQKRCYIQTYQTSSCVKFRVE